LARDVEPRLMLARTGRRRRCGTSRRGPLIKRTRGAHPAAPIAPASFGSFCGLAAISSAGLHATRSDRASVWASDFDTAPRASGYGHASRGSWATNRSARQCVRAVLRVKPPKPPPPIFGGPETTTTSVVAVSIDLDT